MYKLDFNKPEHVYFIGIGGISMSGLAQILLDTGFKVSGSDAKESDLTKKLENLGANIFYGQAYENIKDDIDLIVYTAAIKEDNPEYKSGKDKNIPMISRAVLLGQLMDNYNKSVAVSGTHGKTSTTSMLSHILLKSGVEPTISVGGKLDLIGGNIRIGKREVFLTEACEYTNSFLELNPYIGVILNVETDHLDFFKDLDDIRNSFREFVKKLNTNGKLIINNSIDNYKDIVSDFKGRVITFGLKDSDIVATDINYDKKGIGNFKLLIKKEKYPYYDFEKCLVDNEEYLIVNDVKLSVVGKHNILNALAAIATSLELGIDIEDIKISLREYKGVGRRFEFKGIFNDNITIIDDYAHHPQEIEATLNAARNLDNDEIVCVFQPHTYTRTKAFLNEFANTLSLADKVILADIYAAREKDNLGISSKDIEELINKNTDKIKAYYLGDFETIEKFLRENLKTGDLLITMGAGDIDKVADKLLK